MKRIWLILLGIMGALVIAALVVPFLVPAEVYKTQIERSATNALQRDVQLNGDVSISVFPRISASVENVTVANLDGFEAEHMIKAGALSGSVKWLPLLSGKVDVQELSFIDADVRLQKRADGRGNWEFPEKETTSETSDEGGTLDAAIASARLDNATLSYTDDQAGTSYTLKAFNVKASMQATDEPLKAAGDGIFQDEAFAFDIVLDSPALAMEGTRAELTLTLTSDLANIDYDGAFTLAEAPSLDGRFSLDAKSLSGIAKLAQMELPIRPAALGAVKASGKVIGPLDALAINEINLTQNSDLLTSQYQGSIALGGNGQIAGEMNAASSQLRELLTAADIELAPGETLKSFDVSTTLDGSFKAINLNDLNLSLDEIRGKGTAAIDLKSTRPSLKANLETGPLDLSPFLTTSSPAPETQGWSKEPLDLAGLQAVDADIALTTPSLTFGDIVITDAALSAALKGGRLTADLSRFKTFGGDWAGKMLVNAQQASTPIVSFQMQGQNVVISELLGTLAGFDKLTGTGDFNVKASATGNSIDAIMNALDGNVSTNLGEGALKGINVGQIVRSAESLKTALASGSLQQLDFSNVLSPSAETDFTDFTTALTIKNGKANVDILKLLNPVLGIDGSGQIDLAGQALDLRLATSIDSNAVGDGSVVQLNGIPVPVRISGPWRNLKLSPDLSGVTSALRADLEGQLRDEIGSRLGKELNSQAGGILSGVLGSQTDDVEPESDTDEDEAKQDAQPRKPASVEDAAENALKDLFGRKKKD